jgi:hypothetical protein
MCVAWAGTDANTSGLLHTERGMWINMMPSSPELAQGAAQPFSRGPISALPLDAQTGQPLSHSKYPPHGLYLA